MNVKEIKEYSWNNPIVFDHHFNLEQEMDAWVLSNTTKRSSRIKSRYSERYASINETRGRALRANLDLHDEYFVSDVFNNGAGTLIARLEVPQGVYDSARFIFVNLDLLDLRIKPTS